MTFQNAGVISSVAFVSVRSGARHPLVADDILVRSPTVLSLKKNPLRRSPAGPLPNAPNGIAHGIAGGWGVLGGGLPGRWKTTPPEDVGCRPQ